VLTSKFQLGARLLFLFKKIMSRPRNVWQLEGRLAAGEIATLVLDTGKEPVLLPFDKLCATLRGATNIPDPQRALQVVVLNIDCSRSLALRVADSVPELAVVCWTTPTEKGCARAFLEAFYAEIVAPRPLSHREALSSGGSGGALLLPVQLAFSSGQEALDAHHRACWRTCRSMGAPAPAPAPTPSLVLGHAWAGPEPPLSTVAVVPGEQLIDDALDAGLNAVAAAAADVPRAAATDVTRAAQVHVSRRGSVEIFPAATGAVDVQHEPAPVGVKRDAPRVHVSRRGSVEIFPAAGAEAAVASAPAAAAPAPSMPSFGAVGGGSVTAWLEQIKVAGEAATVAALARNAALERQLGDDGGPPSRYATLGNGSLARMLPLPIGTLSTTPLPSSSSTSTMVAATTTMTPRREMLLPANSPFTPGPPPRSGGSNRPKPPPTPPLRSLETYHLDNSANLAESMRQSSKTAQRLAAMLGTPTT
jgi:hypothetical protein